jgi:hypothetical protein
MELTKGNHDLGGESGFQGKGCVRLVLPPAPLPLPLPPPPHWVQGRRVRAALAGGGTDYFGIRMGAGVQRIGPRQLAA